MLVLLWEKNVICSEESEFQKYIDANKEKKFVAKHVIGYHGNTYFGKAFDSEQELVRFYKEAGLYEGCEGC